MDYLLLYPIVSNTCSIKDWHLHMFEFTDANAFIVLHPPHHLQDGPFL